MTAEILAEDFCHKRTEHVHAWKNPIASALERKLSVPDLPAFAFVTPTTIHVLSQEISGSFVLSIEARTFMFEWSRERACPQLLFLFR